MLKFYKRWSPSARKFSLAKKVASVSSRPPGVLSWRNPPIFGKLIGPLRGTCWNLIYRTDSRRGARENSFSELVLCCARAKWKNRIKKSLNNQSLNWEQFSQRDIKMIRSANNKRSVKGHNLCNNWYITTIIQSPNTRATACSERKTTKREMIRGVIWTWTGRRKLSDPPEFTPS